MFQVLYKLKAQLLQISVGVVDGVYVCVWFGGVLAVCGDPLSSTCDIQWGHLLQAYASMHACLYMYVCMYVHMYVCAHVYVYVYVHVHVYVYVQHGRQP